MMQLCSACRCMRAGYHQLPVMYSMQTVHDVDKNLARSFCRSMSKSTRRINTSVWLQRFLKRHSAIKVIQSRWVSTVNRSLFYFHSRHEVL